MTAPNRTPRRAIVRRRPDEVTGPYAVSADAVVTATVERLGGAAGLTPGRRIARTIMQVVLAVAGAIPAAIALLPVRPDQAAWAVGIAGAIVVVVTAAWNGLEALTGHTVAAPRPLPPVDAR